MIDAHSFAVSKVIVTNSDTVMKLNEPHYANVRWW